MLRAPVESDGRVSAMEWVKPPPSDYQKNGVRFVLTLPRPVTQVAWHRKGNYFASVHPGNGVSDAVAVHSLLRRHSAYHFRKGRDVQRVAFHPAKPLFFLATKTHVRVYNLQTNTLVKKLTTGAKWVSSIAVHPQVSHRRCSAAAAAPPPPHTHTHRHHRRHVTQARTHGTTTRTSLVSVSSSHHHHHHHCYYCYFLLTPLFLSHTRQGDNLIVGTLDRRLCWFDLDLSTKPYKTLRYHRLALRAVCYHPRYPLFASAGDEGAVHVFHGMVYVTDPLLPKA
jgi:WD40 repeat protein